MRKDDLGYYSGLCFPTNNTHSIILNPAPNPSDKTTIAILPFVNMSTSEENEYFSDGITEEIINALAKIDGLRVTSRTSSFHYKGQNIPILEIGKRVGVILKGGNVDVTQLPFK